MHSYARPIVGLATLGLSVLCFFGSGCGSNPAGNLVPGQNDVGDDPLFPAGSGTMSATVETDDYGRYDLIGREGEDKSGEWTFSVRAGRTAPRAELRFAWDFGDGQTLEGTDQTHTFDENGTHVIKVRAYKSDGTLAFVLTLNIEIAIHTNRAPMARAGADLTVDSNELVFLYAGESSDPDGDPLAFRWTQISGGPVLLQQADLATASFVTPVVASDSEFVFSVSASDGDQASMDDVVVRVLKYVAPSTVTVVTADAGEDQPIAGQATITQNQLVSLDGTGSNGTGGNPLSFAWSQTAGPGVLLQGANQAISTFAAPPVRQQQVLEFELVVTSADQSVSDMDTITVTVAAEALTPGTDPTTLDPCEVDSDSDGVWDCEDRCPGLPDNADSDSDGIPDCLEGAAPSRLVAAFSTAPVTIDGILDLDEWSDANTYSMDALDALVPGVVVGGTLATRTDTRADILLKQDGAYFYVGVRVYDDAVVPTATNVWNADSVELFIDTNNSLTTDIGTSRYQVDVNAGGEIAATGGVPAGSWIGDGAVTAEGYELEFRIDRASAGLTSGTTYGFDVALIDVEPTAGTVETRYFFFSTSEASRNESLWGTLEFESGTATPATIAFSPSSLNFGDATGNLTFEVWANGGTLGYSAASNAAWMSVSPTSGTSSGEHDTITATVDRTGLPTGPRTAQITLTPNNGGAAVNLSVAMSVAAAVPVLAVAPLTLDFGSATNSLTFQAWNSASGTLSYSVSETAAWLSCTPTSGTSTGERDTITCTANRTGLSDGAYSAPVTVTPPSPAVPIAVAVSMSVVSPPALSVTPTSIDFGSTATSLTFQAWNSAGGTLNYTIAESAAWLSCTPASGTSTGEHDTVTCAASRTGLSDGPYTAPITVSGQSPIAAVTVAVSMSVTSTPALSVAPTSLDFGSTGTSLTFQAWNSGSGTLTYAISESISWLACTPTGGTSTGEHDTITCTADRTGMSAGNYGPSAITVSAGTTTTPVNASMSVPGAGGVLPMTTASRTSGVAPLAVFFDAVNPASGVVQPTNGDYASPYYKWSFGDSGSGAWATNGKSKNEATGFVTAHVFETPGTYPVSLRVITAGGQSYDYTQTITVQAFSGTTYYVSSSTGSDSYNGLSTSAAFASLDKAFTFATTNTRILLKRGDSWTITASIGLSSPGLSVGAYGDTGSKPRVVSTTSQKNHFRFFASDCRLMDLELTSDETANTLRESPGGIGATNRHCLVMRVHLHHSGMSYMADDPTGSEYQFLVESLIEHTGNHNVYMKMPHYALLGNTLRSPVTEQCVRLSKSNRVVVSHNEIVDPPTVKSAIKSHSDLVVISDNYLRNGWAIITMGNEYDQPIVGKNTLIERNTIVQGWNNRLIGVQIHDYEIIVIRNNIFLDVRLPISVSSAAYDAGDLLPQQRYYVYHNSAFDGRDRTEGEPVFFSAGVVNASDYVIRNNLYSTPFAAPGRLVSSETPVLADHNLYANQVGFTNPATGDLRLAAGSSAIDAAVDVGIPYDFAGNARSDDPSRPNVGGGAVPYCDIGALEFLP